MKYLNTLGLTAALMCGVSSAALAESHAMTLTPGQATDMILLPKFLGILVFDQANEGAMEAHAELGNTGTLSFLGPTPENSVAGQIEIMTTAATQGVGAVMLSNNAGDQIAPAAEALQAAGAHVVTWDSPIPSAAGEAVFRRAGRFRQHWRRDGRHGAVDPGRGRRRDGRAVGNPGCREPERLDRRDAGDAGDRSEVCRDQPGRYRLWR